MDPDFITVEIDGQRREIRNPFVKRLYDREAFSHWSDAYLGHLWNGNPPESKQWYAEQFRSMLAAHKEAHPDLALAYRQRLDEWERQQYHPEGKPMDQRILERMREDAALAADMLRKISQ